MNKFVKYLLCFFVGFLIARMIGDGFSVGGIEGNSLDDTCDKKLNELCYRDRRFSNNKCLECTGGIHQEILRINNCKSEIKEWCSANTSRNYCPKTILEFKDYTDNYTDFYNKFKVDTEDNKEISKYYDRYGVCVQYNNDKIIPNANTKDKCIDEGLNPKTSFQWCVYPSRTFVLTDEMIQGNEPIIDILLTNDATGNDLIPEANYVHISDWDTSQVTNMNNMFNSMTNFNADISRWDTSNVTRMDQMFELCKKFNGDISRWDVSNVTEMTSMFVSAKEFDRDLSGWDVSKVVYIEDIFQQSGINDYFYCLRKWNVKSVDYFTYLFVGCKFAQNFANNSAKYPDLKEIFEILDDGRFDFKSDETGSLTNAVKKFFTGECDTEKCPSCKTS